VAQRVLILSDTHLGRPRCAARSGAALRPLWQGIDHLVLNGDVGEVHHPLHWPASAREVMHLLELAEADGVQVTLLSGNHDPYLSDLRHLTLARGEVFVTHGDVLHPAVAPWSPAAARMRAAHQQALEATEPPLRETLESRLAAAQHASFAEWNELRRESARSTIPRMLLRPWAIAQVFAYWRAAPRLAAEFAAAHCPGARFVVVGHTHRPSVRRVRGRTIINTGSFGFPGRPYAVLVGDALLEVRRVIDRGHEYQLDPRSAARFRLASPVGGPAAPLSRSATARPSR
jgi:UDP-2,3-diacylglucosamine pyrophosphatase LpxH